MDGTSMTIPSDDKPRRKVAVHETAHTVAAMLLGSIPENVTIEPDADEGSTIYCLPRRRR